MRDSEKQPVVRKFPSQTSLKNDSEKEAKQKRLTQEETVEQGSVSGLWMLLFQTFNLARLFLLGWPLVWKTWKCQENFTAVRKMLGKP